MDRELGSWGLEDFVNGNNLLRAVLPIVFGQHWRNAKYGALISDGPSMERTEMQNPRSGRARKLGHTGGRSPVPKPDTKNLSC